MTKISSKTSLTAISISTLFILSSIAVPTALAASNATPAALAATPLLSMQANWASPDGNQFNQNYNPQNVINNTNVQYLGLSWLFPLPTHPTALLSVSGGLGVDSSPLIINGTVYALTQYGQIFALNAANGNVLWNYVLPLNVNSTQGLGAGSVSLHFHQGNEAFTTTLFKTSANPTGTPTLWITAPNRYAYAFNAATGAQELNFSFYQGIKTIPGNNPISVYATLTSAIVLDQARGIAITSMVSSSSNNGARCFFKGWNVNVNPPTNLWTSFCSPPQPGSGLAVDPTWDIKQVNNMTGAYIFKGYGVDNAGGYGDATGAVNLKTLSTTQLNSTLYNDWGYVQSAHCASEDGGASPGATGAGWGAPWIIDQKTGIAYVNTGNKGPYTGDCQPGPDLWSSAQMALNDTNGQWIWGFQASPHDMWDYDCSWNQALANETISGVTTQVLFKTCKSGYLFALNAKTGAMLWSWTPPTSLMARCHFCYMNNPLNSTDMSKVFFNPSLADTIMQPPAQAGFESDFSYNPALNYLFLASQNVPALMHYVQFNSTNYGHGNGDSSIATAATAKNLNNCTIEAVNAATGQMVWSHFINTEGYRGGITTSGGVVFLTLSSGDVLMLDAKTGNTLKDLYIGGPLNVLPSIGATTSGTMEVIFPITAGSVTWGTGVPGDIVALSLQNVPASSASTITTTATVSASGSGATATTTQTITANGSTGVSSTTLYGVAAVAVIFIIATGYLAMRGRKPAP